MSVPKGYKRTEVGVVPEEWEVAKLRDCLAESPRYGINAPAVPHSDLLPAYIRITDITDEGQYAPGTSVSVNRADAYLYYLQSGDIVFARTGASVGKSYLHSERNGRLVFAGFLINIRANRQKLIPAYLAAVATTEPYWRWVRLMSMRSGQPGINGREYGQLNISVPPIKEQLAIAEALGDVDALLGALDAAIAKQRDLKQATMQQLLTGQTRLPGFAGEWKNSSYAEVFVKINAKEYQVQTSEYSEVGSYPIVDQGKVAIVGYSDRHEKVFKCPMDGVVIFGDHTCIVKFVDFNFVVGADGTQILAATTGSSARFHAYQLEFRGIQTTGYNRHFKFLKERPFVSPIFPEQTAIATILSDLDATLTALASRRTKTAALKQAMMQSLLTGRIRLV